VLAAEARLLRRLDRTRRRPVAWVWGPPGAGKTTLACFSRVYLFGHNAHERDATRLPIEH